MTVPLFPVPPPKTALPLVIALGRVSVPPPPPKR
jgi:hypothetical protein